MLDVMIPSDGAITGRDVKDWYQLTINYDRTQYYHDSIWKDLTYHEEVIHCRGGEDVSLPSPILIMGVSL